MKVIAISGSIASGKDTVSKIFLDLGCRIFDADQVVHKIFIDDKLVIKKIADHFPQAQQNNVIKREILAQIITQNPDKIKIIEQIIHPLVQEKYQQFIELAKIDNCKCVVLNIPLILESNFYKFDYLVAIITEQKIRLNRYLARIQAQNNQQLNQQQITDLTLKFNILNNKQIDDKARISRADFVIENNYDLINIKNKIVEIYQKIISN